MCGILVLRNGGPFHHRLLSSLRRRGPDDVGFWSRDDLHIGHTRLSVLGLDERGTQPMENATHVLAFNGEIYNFLELKARLAARGVRVSGTSDTEVLLHAWTEWGPEVLRELVGFWAFAVYDKRAHTLTLVRDQFGVKPLYYYRDGDALCVSSLVRTIVDVVGRGLSLDYGAVSEYVRYQFTFGDRTFLERVRKVRPGHAVELSFATGAERTWAYDDILAAPDAGAERVDDAWVGRTRELLGRAVLESTISDASFTTFCSGGVDSSLITRLAAPEVAYHCNYSDPECNETFFAKQVVEGTGTRLFVINADEQFDLVDRLRQVVEDFDELTIGSVILPLENLLAQVKRRYKVILTGTGGDELFAGYVRYQLVSGQCFQDSYKALFARMRAVEGPAARFELTHRKGDPSLYRFYDPGVERTFHAAFEDCRGSGGDVAAMLRFDRRYFLQGLLNIDDKMCGRHSLESRPSFLHQEFVRHVLRVDPAELLPGEELKPVLRRVAAGVLPASVVHRTDKMGFTTPIGTFVNNSAHRIREQITESPFRDLYDLRRLHLHAENKFSRETFGLLMLDLWLNRYAAAPSADPAPLPPGVERTLAAAARNGDHP